MAIPARFYRVPVLIFAVLLAGIYVYAKAGGPLPGTSSSKSAPGSNPISFSGSKSAMVLSPDSYLSEPPLSTSGNEKAVLPGSKFGPVFKSEIVKPRIPSNAPYGPQPAQKGAPPYDLPQQRFVPSIAPNPPVQPAAPNSFRPAQNPASSRTPASNAVASPASHQPAPARPVLTLPGSKSAPLIGPEMLAPSTTNTSDNKRPALPTSQPQPTAPPQPARQQSTSQLPQQPPSPQQSMRQTLHRWIDPPMQPVRAPSR